MPRARAPNPRIIPKFFPCSEAGEKREAKEDKPGFKNALPKEMIPRARMVKPKLREKLKTTSPKNKDNAPNIAIFFSAIFPDIRRITPP